MFNLFKKKIVLNCYTYSNTAFDLFPVSKASDFFPSWWKRLSKTFIVDSLTRPTIKKCVGINEYFKQGIMIPMWSEIAFMVGADKSYHWLFSDGRSTANPHHQGQWNAFADPNTTGHLKIDSVWIFECDEDINWIVTEPFWNHPVDRQYRIPTGMLEFKYQRSSHINMFIDLTKEGTFGIDAGTPMMHLIPMSDRKIDLKLHLISQEAYMNKIHAPIAFVDKYKKIKRILKKQCPFSSD